MKRTRAFSLLEVTIAMAVVAFALLAVLSLLPVALKASSDATNDTRTSMIAQDVQTRIRTLPPPATAGGTVTRAWWYDSNARWVSMDASSPDYSKVLYRVDLTLARLNSYPSSTDPAQQDPANTYSTQLVSAVAKISWPANNATGASPSGNGSQTTYTFYTRATPDL